VDCTQERIPSVPGKKTGAKRGKVDLEWEKKRPLNIYLEKNGVSVARERQKEVDREKRKSRKKVDVNGGPILRKEKTSHVSQG